MHITEVTSNSRPEGGLVILKINETIKTIKNIFFQNLNIIIYYGSRGGKTNEKIRMVYTNAVISCNKEKICRYDIPHLS